MVLSKPILILLVLFLALLPISFPVSAVSVSDETSNVVVSLPFPSPESFGENSQSVVLYNSAKQRYTYFVLTYDLGSLVSNPSSVIFSATLNCKNNDSNATFNYISFKVRASGPFGTHAFDTSDHSQSIHNQVVVASNLHLYQFNWVPGTNQYSVAERSLNSSGLSDTSLVYRPYNGESNVFSYVYGSNSLPYEWSTKYTQTFNGTTVNVRVPSNISYSFASSDSGAILSVLNDMNGTVRFYLGQILSKLTSDDGYTPEQTTINSDMSDYDNAEGALMDNNINALNNLAMPDIDNFNSGKQGNAFQFISSNIEFFGGMNGSGSIAKVGTVLLLILALGLTSFVIGLSNRKKGG